MPEGWNKTWFMPEPASHQVPGSTEHAIFATSWRATGDGSFPLMWAPEVDYVNGIDVTRTYVENSEDPLPSDMLTSQMPEVKLS